MRTRLLVAAACLLLVLAPPAIAAPAGDGDAPVTTLGQQPEGGGIIPRPDSGTEPEDAGDRGGALQTVLFVVMLGGVVVIAGLVVRESRRARANRGF
ncbi:MAG: hypothetical protein OSA99_09805 [Acidimicrobiales bacterium]|nr:hypothetical protein [Acidimicrobiales bacterium]